MADGSLNGDNCYNLLKYLFDGYARNPSMPDGWPPMTIMSGAVSDLCQSMVLNEITVGPVMQESVVDSMNDTMHRSMSVFSRIANDHLHLLIQNKKLPDEVKNIIFKENISILDIVMEIRKCSKSEARRLISANAVKLIINLNNGEAKYVLEVNAGICQRIGLKVGDELKINIAE